MTVTLNYTVRAVEGEPPITACAEWAFWEIQPGEWVAGRFAYGRGKTKKEAKEALIENMINQIAGLNNALEKLRIGKKLPEGIK